MRDKLPSDLTLERVRSAFYYNPLTGDLFKRDSVTLPVVLKSSGKTAMIRVGEKAYVPAKKLAWFLVTGVYPKFWVAPLDRDELNLKSSNLILTRLRGQPHIRKGLTKGSAIPVGIFQNLNGTFSIRYAPTGFKAVLKSPFYSIDAALSAYESVRDLHLDRLIREGIKLSEVVGDGYFWDDWSPARTPLATKRQESLNL